jgi:hypothetical protein
MTMTSLRGALAGFFMTLAALLAPVSHSAEVAGIPFDEQMKLGDVPILLNGAGVRSKFMFKVYALGLYLPRKTTDAVQAIAQTGPKRIRIVTLRGVGADMFLEGLTKGIEKNHTAGELAALKPRLDQFSATLKSMGELAKGSVVTLDALPGGATQLTANGSPLGKSISGEDFYQALMRIWLGVNPAQDSLKAEMLGR